MMQGIKGALQPMTLGPYNSQLSLNGANASNTEPVLCIAVEYVKDALKMSSQDIPAGEAVGQTYASFDGQYINLLDPDMGAVYTEASAKFSNSLQGPVLIRHLVSPQEEQHVSETIVGQNHSADLTPNDFLQMVDGSQASTMVSNTEMEHENQSDGDILVTDQSTGISYLVERCLNDSQLMDPDALLDSDLLALDENALKSELSDIIVHGAIKTDPLESSHLESKQEQFKSSFVSDMQDDDIVPCVQQICDRPIQTRARASLPVSHLIINENQRGEESVFAKNFIPNRTQFGPIEGVLMMEKNKSENGEIHLSIDTNGILQRLDVSNENLSNWMCFVRLATKQAQQNLILYQQDNNLYFRTIRNIHPREELLVGYSASYAQRRNLFTSENVKEIDELWLCYECDAKFGTSQELQEHQAMHEPAMIIDFTNKSNNNGKTTGHLVENVKKTESDKQPVAKKKAEYRCPNCYKCFATGDRIQRHMMVHGDEAKKPLECEKCHKRFINNSALSCHLKTHLFGAKIYECPICNDSFQHILQLKCHVLKHSVDGKYTCPHCKKIFLKYTIIRKHIRAFHCDKVHKCSNCEKAFPTLDKLRMHLLKHSDHREFLCADCGKQFKRKDKLSEHCKKMHNEESELENAAPKKGKTTTKSEPTDYHRFIYKCHTCLLGFKRRGMLVNHLAKRHPDIRPDAVPELNLPIYRTTKNYYCNYCEKIYKSSSKRKAHILKNHPGLALPLGPRGAIETSKESELANLTYSQTVGSVTTHPQACNWCHRQYASRAKLLQHQRKKHPALLEIGKQQPVSPNDASKSIKVEKKKESDAILSDSEHGYYQQLMSLANETNGIEQNITYEHMDHLVKIENDLVPPR